MKKRYYLAYGSNLNLRQMSYRCPDAEVVGTAEIKNYRLLFKGSKTGSYLTIERMMGACVPVAVWAVSDCDEANLDTYEGCPSFYYKKTMTLPIKWKDGTIKTLETFVYIMHEDRPFGIPTECYVNACEEGYREFKFDTAILYKAYEVSRREAWHGGK